MEHTDPESRVSLFRQRREELMGKSDAELVVAADLYLMRKRISPHHDVPIMKASGKVASGIGLKWGERSALANLVSQADASDEE